MKFVFCEGKDDVAVVQGLVKHLGLDLNVERYDGKDKLASFLETLPKRPEFAQQQVKSIAILRDADADSEAAFTSVSNTLQRVGYAAPANDGGFTQTPLKVGVFIIAIDGKGMIEDLCLASVADHPEFPCVGSYFDCLARNSPREFSSKAKVRVWMASQVDHEYHVGKAADEGYWPWESAAFDALKNFLKAL
jgi:hypothetical protein